MGPRGDRGDRRRDGGGGDRDRGPRREGGGGDGGPRREGGDRGPRGEGRGEGAATAARAASARAADDEGPAPEFAPAFLNRRRRLGFGLIRTETGMAPQ